MEPPTQIMLPDNNQPILYIMKCDICLYIRPTVSKTKTNSNRLSIGGFTVTSYAVSRGHPAPLVGKRFLAGGLRVYLCLDSCLVYINCAHTQDHDYVLYLCGGTSGIAWTARFSLLSSKKLENEENFG